MRPAEVSGPRYLDPFIVARVQDATIRKYRAALARSLSPLQRNNYRPQHSHEFDALLVEWRHAEPGVRKGNSEAAISSLEFVLPAFKLSRFRPTQTTNQQSQTTIIAAEVTDVRPDVPLAQTPLAQVFLRVLPHFVTGVLAVGGVWLWASCTFTCIRDGGTRSS